MPEGDTIHRTARTLNTWIGGRTITRAETSANAVDLAPLVGQQVTRVEARAKHLLVFVGPSELVLHTHMRMTGSWHVYQVGAPWKKPAWQAKVQLQCDDRLAVCFNVPVIELLRPVDVTRHRVLSQLGPDLLGVVPVDRDESVARARAFGQSRPIGVVLLDQRVVGGIGNIWRAESLFLSRINPSTSIDNLSDDEVGGVIATAAESMRASVAQVNDGARRFGDAPPGEPWVYKRTGQPCRVCGAVVQSQALGEHARRAYWCPSCQPAVLA